MQGDFLVSYIRLEVSYLFFLLVPTPHSNRSSTFLLQFCIFLFTSFARMFERFECLNADGVREQIETMFKVSSYKSESEVEVVIAVPGGNKNEQRATSPTAATATEGAKFELLSHFCCFCRICSAGHACLYACLFRLCPGPFVSQCSS